MTFAEVPKMKYMCENKTSHVQTTSYFLSRHSPASLDSRLEIAKAARGKGLVRK